MDRLSEMEIFVAVAEARGFAKAAARLRRSPPAVTRAVAALEARLGARLLNRTTRRVALTDAGAGFLDAARRALVAADAAEREVSGKALVPRGHLAVTTSVTFGRSVLAPVLGAFLDAHPQMSVSLTLVDRVVDLIEEGIDLAIRIGDLPDSTLSARRVGEVRRLLVASPAYIARRGAPKRPADLESHATIGFGALAAGAVWPPGRRAGAVAVAPRFVVNDALAAIEAAERGEGITMALSYIVADRIRAGALREVLPAVAPPPVAVQLVHPGSRLVAPKVRAFIDHAAPHLTRALRRLEIRPRTPRR
ncbi:MAG: LysR family transcriptional regulator [Rhodospirillales bacterium]|nr:MAG: LysR family transcriptional regulator [Rhodospirillales bacterium]